MMADPGSMVLYTFVVIILGFIICSFGLKNGIEKITKYIMLSLLFILVALAVNSIFLPGGAEGLSFYLKPDLNRIKSVGVWNVIVSAMNQAFFTLSLGMGAMAIFGSYIDKKRSLLGESVRVAALDTFVAIALRSCHFSRLLSIRSTGGQRS